MCALLASGGINCWGRNDKSQAVAPTGNEYVQIATGDHHSCAVRVDQTVVCWGDNTHGQANVPAELSGSAE